MNVLLTGVCSENNRRFFDFTTPELKNVLGGPVLLRMTASILLMAAPTILLNDRLHSVAN